MQEPDPDLLRRAQTGDLAAFESLVRAYQADAWRFARSLCRDRSLCDDITQDAFVRAFRFIGSFRGDSRFSSWLFSIVRNCANDAMRKAARPAVEPLLRAVAEPQPRAEITIAIEGLPTRLREPFLLVEVYGMPYADAARVLRTKIGTVKSRVHRARAALVDELTDREDAHEV